MSSAADVGPFSISVDSAGRHLYTANARSGSVSSYAIIDEGAALRQLDTLASRPGAGAVVLYEPDFSITLPDHCASAS